MGAPARVRTLSSMHASIEKESDSAADRELHAFEEELARQRRRLAKYLYVRGWVGMGLMVFAGLCWLAALVILGVALGIGDIPAISRWTQGFDAVLAVFMPTALGLIAWRAGRAYWAHRFPDDSDTGCLVA